MNVEENTQMRELMAGELAVVAGGMMNLPGRVSQMTTQPGTTTGSAGPDAWGQVGAITGGAGLILLALLSV
jgi:hypothetical protein